MGNRRYRDGYNESKDIVDSKKNTMMWTGVVEGIIPEKTEKHKLLLIKE